MSTYTLATIFGILCILALAAAYGIERGLVWGEPKDSRYVWRNRFLYAAAGLFVAMACFGAQ